MALGSEGSTAYNSSKSSGYWTTITVIDENIVKKIEQNKIDISNYKSLISQIESLKNIVNECKDDLDSCYNDASLGLISKEFDFDTIKGYAESMYDSVANLDIQLKNIEKQVMILEGTNDDLEKVKYKTVREWVDN